MSIATTQPDADLEERRRQLEADTASTWQSDDNDISLWPTGWNKPIAHPGGEANPYHIPVGLRPFYKRSRQRDQQIIASWPLDYQELSHDPLHPRGLPITLSRADLVGFRDHKQALYSPERERYMLHHHAFREALARKAASEADAHQQLVDQTTRRCDACGSTADASVKRVSIGGWRSKFGSPGPKLCASCFHLINMTCADEYARRARALSVEVTPNGRRDVACAAFVDEHRERLLP